jgi:hypothetical protein
LIQVGKRARLRIRIRIVLLAILAGAFIQSLCPCAIYIIQAILEASLNEDARVEDVDVDNSGTDASVGNAGHDAGVTSDI